MSISEQKIMDLEKNQLADLLRQFQSEVGYSLELEILWSTFSNDESGDDLIRFCTEDVFPAFKAVAKTPLSKDSLKNNIRKLILENSGNVSGKVEIANGSLKSVCNWSVHPNQKKVYVGHLTKVLKLDLLDAKHNALETKIPQFEQSLAQIVSKNCQLEIVWDSFRTGADLNAALDLLASEILPALEELKGTAKKAQIEKILKICFEHTANLQPEMTLESGTLLLRANWSELGVYKNDLITFFN